MQNELEMYKEAFKRLGRFGNLFVEYKGCDRGKMGELGILTDDMSAEMNMIPTITDVDGNQWRPILQNILDKYEHKLKK